MFGARRFKLMPERAVTLPVVSPVGYPPGSDNTPPSAGQAMPPAIRARAVLVLAILLWCALLIAQWAAGPRDGVVTELSRHTDVVVGIGPALGDALGSSNGSEGTRLAFLLLIAPAILVIADHFAGRWQSPGLRWIVVFAAAIGLLSFLELPQLSNDVFLYRSAGEMIADEGLNPYVQTPADHFSPAQLRGIPWSTQASPYGPLALGLFAAVSAITGSWVSSLWMLRFLMAIPWVLAMILIYLDVDRGLTHFLF